MRYVATIFLATVFLLISGNAYAANCLDDFSSGKFFKGKDAMVIVRRGGNLISLYDDGEQVLLLIENNLKNKGVTSVARSFVAIHTELYIGIVDLEVWGEGKNVYAGRVEIGFESWNCDFSIGVGEISRINITDYPSKSYEELKIIVLKKAIDNLFRKIP